MAQDHHRLSGALIIGGNEVSSEAAPHAQGGKIVAAHELHVGQGCLIANLDLRRNRAAEGGEGGKRLSSIAEPLVERVGGRAIVVGGDMQSLASGDRGGGLEASGGLLCGPVQQHEAVGFGHREGSSVQQGMDRGIGTDAEG